MKIDALTSTFSKYRFKSLRWWLSVPLYATRILRKHLRKMRQRQRLHGATWIDVGANRGQLTLGAARYCPGLTVWAFEPTPELAHELKLQAPPNYHVIEAAIALYDGEAVFHLNNNDSTSSLLLNNPDGKWIGGEDIEKIGEVRVQTMRLDTFLNRHGIQKVDWLKVDAQGADLDVVESAGERLSDVSCVTMEVTVGITEQYVGSTRKEAAVSFMKRNAFALVRAESQTHDQEENLTFHSGTTHKCPHGISPYVYF